MEKSNSLNGVAAGMVLLSAIFGLGYISSCGTSNNKNASGQCNSYDTTYLAKSKTDFEKAEKEKLKNDFVIKYRVQ